MIGAAAVLVILVVCLCSNPGGGTDAADVANADSGAETEADAAQQPTGQMQPRKLQQGSLRRMKWIMRLQKRNG